VSNNTIYKWRTDNVVGLGAACYRLAAAAAPKMGVDELALGRRLAGLDD
jgi:hypothetical protein